MTDQLNVFAEPQLPPPTCTLTEADWLDWMTKRPSCSVDLVDTDPPYSSLELHRRKGTTTRMKMSDGSSNEFFPVIPDEKLPELVTQAFRILRPNRHFYVWVDEPTMDVIKRQQFLTRADGSIIRGDSGEYPCASGFTYWRALAWVKTTKDGQRPQGGMGYHWRGAKEFVMFFEKGKRKLNHLGWTDVLLYPRPDYNHATPKPWEGNEALVLNSTQPRELVCDPFAGSGSSAIAAMKSGRSFIGCDIDPVTLENADELLGSMGFAVNPGGREARVNDGAAS